jgi:hypothetical protein
LIDRDRLAGGVTRTGCRSRVEFGVKRSARAGAVIAKTGVGHLKIKLSWTRDLRPEPGEEPEPGAAP